MSEKVISPLLETRQHFQILDGLRGVAAVGVVIFHFMEIAVPDYHDSFISHAYLAVDFFFCLSGFVIAYAYDKRMEKIGLLNFLKLRLVRLHPLVIIGSIIGLLAFALDPFNNLFELYASQVVPMFLTSCLMIPYPLVHERYFNLFHLNPPTWSLFWEYIANIAYAVFLFRLRSGLLWILTSIAAIALFFEAQRSGYLGVGWGGDNIIGGGIRVSFSFLAGLLVYRSSWIIKSKLGFLAVSIVLLLTFFIPFSERLNPFVDPLVVVLIFPLLVALGAGAETKGLARSVCKFSGEISYPLYMVHYPFVWLFMSWVEAEKPLLNQMILVMIVSTILLICVAYFILKSIDVPVRKYFKLKMNRVVKQDAERAVLNES